MVRSNNKKGKSTDLEGTSTPKLDQIQNGAKSSKSGLKLQTPKSGLKMKTPKQNVKPSTPKSNEKKDTSKNGARKSLAVNGSPKLEKTTSTEKTVAVKEEAGTNPLGNKKRNRKRPLSQSGAESVAKTPKLEKFAGTASLDSDKKDEAGKGNRSARRRQQNKEKKKSTAKSGKLDIKAKILEGDIEAQRTIQAKLDALMVKPAAERSNTARRKIKQLQSWLKIKSKEAAGSAAGKVHKAAQKQKQGPKVQIQKVIKTEELQNEQEEPQSDDEGIFYEESSDEGDFETISAECRAEEGSNEEEPDIDEDDSEDD